MKIFWRWSLVLALLVAPVTIFGCKQNTESTENVAPSTGGAPITQSETAATDFSLTTLEGKKLSLSDLKGKPVVVNFWASWCHFCEQEAPLLEALYKEYHSQGLAVVGVGVDELNDVRQKAKEWKLTYPIGVNPQAAREYGVMGVPHTVVINKEGEIVNTFRGAPPKAELEAAVKSVL